MLNNIAVSLVYAEREQQWVYETQMRRGSDARELIVASNFLNDIPALVHCSTEKLELAVFAQKIDLDHLLEEGDRVEIIRPLLADPKIVRREMAKLGKTIGKQRND